MVAPGRIVVLNGPSSAGKTTLARALQACWPDPPLLYLALDMAIGVLPFAFTGTGEHAASGYRVGEAVAGRPDTVGYALGRHGRRLNAGLAACATALAGDGYDIVLDHVIADAATMRDLVRRVDPGRSWLVAVTAAPDVLTRRERARGDRVPGLAAAQRVVLERLGWPSDLAIDTSDGIADPAPVVARLATAPAALQRLAAR